MSEWIEENGRKGRKKRGRTIFHCSHGEGYALVKHTVPLPFWSLKSSKETIIHKISMCLRITSNYT